MSVIRPQIYEHKKYGSCVDVAYDKLAIVSYCMEYGHDCPRIQELRKIKWAPMQRFYEAKDVLYVLSWYLNQQDKVVFQVCINRMSVPKPHGQTIEVREELIDDLEIYTQTLQQKSKDELKRQLTEVLEPASKRIKE